MKQAYSAERVSPSEGGYVIHDEAGFEGMRRAGRLAAETLDMITPEVKPGVTTEYLNRLCHDFIEARGASECRKSISWPTPTPTISPAANPAATHRDACDERDASGGVNVGNAITRAGRSAASRRRKICEV